MNTAKQGARTNVRDASWSQARAATRKGKRDENPKINARAAAPRVTVSARVTSQAQRQRVRRNEKKDTICRPGAGVLESIIKLGKAAKSVSIDSTRTNKLVQLTRNATIE